MKLQGCYTALITPMKNGNIDFKSYEKILKFQKESLVQGVVPCGSTGEGSVLSEEEYLKILKKTKEVLKKEKTIIAGIGSNSTKKTLSQIKKVENIVDALLIIVPYYNKPTQKGIYEHFSIIAKNTKLPIILYNIPSRTGVNMLAETVIALAKKHSNIIGIKEASGNLDQASQIIGSLDKSFNLLSGDDSLTLPLMSIGGKGVISVASNIIPNEIENMCESFLNSKFEEAILIHHKYFNFIKNLFLETNPIPIKYIMSLKSFCKNELRLPLLEMSEEKSQILKKEFLRLKI